MNYKSHIFLLLIILSLSSYSQKRKIDSLIYLIKTTKNACTEPCLKDTNKILTLNILGKEFMNTKPDTSFILFSEALTLCEQFPVALKSKIKPFLAISTAHVGLYYFSKSDFPKAIEYNSKALEIEEELGNKLRIARNLGNSANIYSSQGNYNKSLDLHSKALKIYEEIGDKDGIAVTLGNIGTTNVGKEDYHEAKANLIKAVKMFEELGDKSSVALNLGNLGTVYTALNDYPKAVEVLFNALKIERESGNKRGVTIILSSIGVVYKEKGDYPKAVEYFLIALRTYEELGHKVGIAATLNNLGNIHKYLGDYTKSLDCFLKALKINEELGNKNKIGINLGNIGILHRMQRNYSQALESYIKALEIFEQSGNKRGMAVNLSNIANVYEDKGDYTKAQEYNLMALKLETELGNNRGRAQSLCQLGSLYIKTAKFKEAEESLIEALKLSNKLGALALEESAHLNISLLYDTLSKFPEAQLHSREELFRLTLFHYKKHRTARDSIHNIENAKKSLRTQMEYDYDKKEIAAKAEFDKQHALSNVELEKRKLLLAKNRQDLVLLEKENELKELNLTQNASELKQKVAETENQQKAIELLNKDKKLKAAEGLQKEEELKKQRLISYTTTGGGVLVLALLFFAVKGYNQKKKANKIITEQNILVEKQKNEVEIQKQVVEEHQKEIIDSITYAKRLQQAILPPSGFINKYLPNSFVLYKPKDIVAGDFYWMESLNDGGNAEAEMIYIAAADCTGHGVPGALVSIVCSNALNRTVKEFALREPGKILDKVTELVLETFAKSGEEIKDGMDISLLAIDKTNKLIQWSGANNPLWYIENNELKEIKADKQPIGQFEGKKPFTTHTLPFSLTGNHTFYLFTDGYPDQFGGEKGKKFMYKNFSNLLLANSIKPLSEQKEILHRTFEQWKGATAQTDDMCVIGLRL